MSNNTRSLPSPLAARRSPLAAKPKFQNQLSHNFLDLGAL
jgi:hypothetical protein